MSILPAGLTAFYPKCRFPQLLKYLEGLLVNEENPSQQLSVEFLAEGSLVVTESVPHGGEAMTDSSNALAKIGVQFEGGFLQEKFLLSLALNEKGSAECRKVGMGGK